MVPQPTTATPTGPVEAPHQAPPLRGRPGAVPAGQPGQAVPDRGHHVGRAAIELDHVPSRGRARGQDLGHRHPPGADRRHEVVPVDHRTVLDVQVADPVAQPAQQRGHILPADRRPVGIDLEQHRVVELIREHLQRGNPAHQGGELEIVVVVAQAQAPAGHPGGHLVQLTGQRLHALGVGEPGRRQVRDDDGVRAEGASGAHDGVGLLTRRRRVHAAREQAGRVQVGPQPVRVVTDAERFHRAVAQGGDVRQDARSVGGQLVPDGVELQGRRVGGQGSPSRKLLRLPPTTLSSLFARSIAICRVIRDTDRTR